MGVAGGTCDPCARAFAQVATLLRDLQGEQLPPEIIERVRNVAGLVTAAGNIIIEREVQHVSTQL